MKIKSDTNKNNDVDTTTATDNNDSDSNSNNKVILDQEHLAYIPLEKSLVVVNSVFFHYPLSSMFFVFK